MDECGYKRRRFISYDNATVNQCVRIAYELVRKRGLNFLNSILGYGRYFRDNGDTCMTDEYGKYKFHYCKDTGAGADVCKEGPPQQVQYNKRQQMGHERLSLIAYCAHLWCTWEGRRSGIGVGQDTVTVSWINSLVWGNVCCNFYVFGQKKRL